MTTSNSFDFSVNRNQIIKKALQILGVLPEGQEPNDTQYVDASVTVNLIAKSYLSEGLLEWNRKVFVLFPEQGKAKYILNNNHGNRWTTEDDLVYSNLDTSAVGGSVSILLSEEVSSPFVIETPEIVTGSNIGVKLDNGVFHWTTVNTVLSQQNFVLEDPLPSGVSQGNRVYLHNKIANVPHNIVNISRRTSSDNDIQLLQHAVRDYQWLSSKTHQGTPSAYALQGSSDKVELYLWPTPRVEERIYILGNKGFDDLDDSGDTLPMSNEVFLAFVWEVAANLAFEYGTAFQVISMINRRAKIYKDQALSYAMENAYIKLEPDARFGDMYK